MLERSLRASGDQMIARLRRAIPRVLLVEEIYDVEGLALAGVQRLDALVDFLAELTKLLHMRQQAPANLVLVCFRECRYLGDRLFEYFRHVPKHSGLSVRNRRGPWGPLRPPAAPVQGQAFERAFLVRPIAANTPPHQRRGSRRAGGSRSFFGAFFG